MRRTLGTAGGDLSLWGLFLEADIVVKLVMLGLLGGQHLGLGRSVREMVQPAQGEPCGRRVRGPVLVRRQPGRAVRPGRHQSEPSDGRGVRRGDGGVAADGARRRGRCQSHLRARTHRPCHRGDGAARDGPAGTVDGVPRLGRRDGAVHRAVRHGVGDHALASRRSRRCTTPTSRWSRRASPRRCSPPRSAWSRRSRRCWRTTRSARTSRVSPPRLEGFGTEFGAILSRQSEERGLSHGVFRFQASAPARALSAAVGDQRHAAGRRDAGAADHLHGHRAADDLRRIGRPAEDRRAADQQRQPAA